MPYFTNSQRFYPVNLFKQRIFRLFPDDFQKEILSDFNIRSRKRFYSTMSRNCPVRATALKEP